jgi:hypothetical protein
MMATDRHHGPLCRSSITGNFRLSAKGVCFVFMVDDGVAPVDCSDFDRRRDPARDAAPRSVINTSALVQQQGPMDPPLVPLYSLVPKRKRDEDELWCSFCNASLPRGTTVRYSSITGSAFCDKHGRVVQRQIRRLCRADAVLLACVNRYGPAILRYLSLDKVRHILSRPNKAPTVSPSR